VIKYSITVSDGKRSATCYIESLYPLVGDEPIVQERLKATLDLIEPESEYMKTFKSIILEGAKNG
jgi:hypothetical protein